MNKIKQNTEEWLEFRKSRIGGSDAPIVMGVSPWKTPYELWLEKLGLSNSQMNAPMRRGHDLEATARMEFELDQGFKVEPQVITHKVYDWMIASLDGIDETRNKIVEIKCPGREDHSRALEGDVPIKYYPQLQHQIEVAGVEEAYYFSWTPDTFVTLTVKRNDAYINRLIEKEKEFYECLQHLTPPPMGNRDCVQRKDELWTEASGHWKSVKEQVILLEKTEKEMRETLIHLSGGKNCIGNGVKLLKSARRGNIDYSQVQELNGVDLEKYRRETSCLWRITSHE